jgi:hypothetical protein
MIALRHDDVDILLLHKAREHEASCAKKPGTFGSSETCNGFIYYSQRIDLFFPFVGDNISDFGKASFPRKWHASPCTYEEPKCDSRAGESLARMNLATDFHIRSTLPDVGGTVVAWRTLP